MRLDKRFGKTMAGLSIGTSAISWTDGAIDTYKIFKMMIVVELIKLHRL